MALKWRRRAFMNEIIGGGGELLTMLRTAMRRTFMRMEQEERSP
jgi:hypothetical protein